MSKQTARKLREYEGIWEKIKAENKATIRVTPAFAATVRKAVKKEKWMDKAWQVLHDDDDYSLKISYDGTQYMTFEIKRRIGEL